MALEVVTGLIFSPATSIRVPGEYLASRKESRSRDAKEDRDLGGGRRGFRACYVEQLASSIPLTSEE